MESLNKIQKVFRVFMILTKVGMIVSFVAAGLSMLGLSLGSAWYSGAAVSGTALKTMFFLTETRGLSEMTCALLTDMVFALMDGILLLFAFRYFQAEQVAGTPFTQEGAVQIRRLGVRTIVLPLVAAGLAAAFCELFNAPQSALADWSSASSISLGVVLILASLNFRYGAELENKA